MLQFAASFLRLSSEIGQVLEFFVQRDAQDQGSADLLFFTAFANRAIVSDRGSGYNRDRPYSTEKGGILFAFGGNPADAVRDAGGQWV